MSVGGRAVIVYGVLVFAAHLLLLWSSHRTQIRITVSMLCATRISDHYRLLGHPTTESSFTQLQR